MTYARILAQLPTAVTAQLIETTAALYAPAHVERGFEAPTVMRDQPYGADPQQQLDVHIPGGSASGLPLLLFVPGGGFVAGDRRTPGTPYNDHVGRWAADLGMAAATMSYRPAPGAPWPAGSRDVAAAVSWLTEHAEEFGADPERIVVMGHSAGAAHVAGFLVGHGGVEAPKVAAAVLVSGIFSLKDAEHDDLMKAYYGDQPAEYPDREALPRLVTTETPTLYAVAEHDAPLFHQQFAWLCEAYMARTGRVPASVVLSGHNHISEILSLGVDDTVLTAAVSSFLSSVLPRG